MNVSLRPDLQRFIEQKVSSGQYATPDEVVQAGLAALKQQESFGEFEPGELSALVAEGEQSLREFEALDADDALMARRARRSKGRDRVG